MAVANRVTRAIILVAVVVTISAMAASAQLPIPVQGQRGAQAQPGVVQGQRGQGGQGGQRGQQALQPQDPPPVVSQIATTSPEVTGPGRFFETLMELKPGDDLAHFKYVTK